MTPEQELELLELISSLPSMDSAPLPPVTVEDPFLFIPAAVEEYLKALGYTPELQKDGRMHVKDYVEMIDNLGITRHSASTIFKTVSSKSEA